MDNQAHHLHLCMCKKCLSDEKATPEEFAYGLLWMVTTNDPLVHAARRKLLIALDKPAQSRGIAAARKMRLPRNQGETQ